MKPPLRVVFLLQPFTDKNSLLLTFTGKSA